LLARWAVGPLLLSGLFCSLNATGQEAAEAPLAIEPSEPTTEDTLRVVIPEGAIVSWLKNGEATEHSGSSLSEKWTRKGEKWSAVVTLGEDEQRVSVTVGNARPAVAKATLSTGELRRGEAVSCMAISATDPDEDKLILQYSWRIDEKLVSQRGETLESGVVRRGQSVRCEVKASDGSASSEPVMSEPATVVNTLPSLTSVSVTPAAPAGNTPIQCQASGAKDPDGDPLRYAFAWEISGGDSEDKVEETLAKSTAELPADTFQRGQQARCTVRVLDDEGASEPKSAAVTVVNSAPTLAGATLSSETAVTTDTLRCAAKDAKDLDEDALKMAYRWLVNSKVQHEGETLPAEKTAKGNWIACEARASDGDLHSKWRRSKALQIANSVPVVDGARLASKEIRLGEALECTAGATSDPDGDPVTLRYRWTADERALTGTSARLKSGFRKGQVIACAVTPFDGTASGETASSGAAKVLNTAPSLASVTMSPETPLSNQDLRCRASGAGDADGDAIAIDWAWFEGEKALENTTDTLKATDTRRDATYRCRATPSDGEATGEPLAASQVVGNVAPAAGKVVITPAKALTSDGIRCEATGFTDADNDALSLEISWKVDGALLEVTTPDLASEQTKAGQRISCSVRASDGEKQSPPVNSSEIRIQNTPPTLSAVTVEPAAPTRESELRCVPGKHADADGDEVRFQTSWEVAGRVLGSGAVLPPGKARKGDEVRCVSRPRDGVALGEPVSATVRIGNLKPVIGKVSISPGTARRGTALRCLVAGASDPDGDKLQLAYRWFKGADQLEETSEKLAGAQVVKGAAYRCEAQASDGESETPYVRSEPLSPSNTAPTLGAATVEPSSPTVVDDLSCGSADPKDADGDALALEYRWKVAGAAVSETGKTLGAGQFKAGNRVSCSVRASDGEAKSAYSYAAEVAIRNTPPVLESVRITPENPMRTDSIQCVPGESSDVDGHKVQLQTRWEVDGRLIAKGASIAGSLVRKGDKLTCSTRPFDGLQLGEAVTAAVTIANSPPAIASVRISPTQARNGTALQCKATGATDPDQEAVTLSYRWWAGESQLAEEGEKLPGSKVRKDIPFRCAIKASDGSAETPFVDAEPVTPANTPPVLAAVSLEPKTPTVSDELTCKAGELSDVDSDKVTLAYTWTIDGRLTGNTWDRLKAGVTRRGQRVQCVATPNDGVVDGTKRAAAQVTVRNSLPTIGSVRVEPSVPKTTDSPSCVASGAVDADEDPVSYRYSWLVNGVVTTARGSTLSSALFKRGDSIQCAVKGFDGVGLGPEQSSRPVTVNNSAPKPGRASISPSIARTGTALTCTASGFTDPDADKLELEYSWTVDGEPVEGSSASIAEGFGKGDQVICAVRAFDGEERSAPASSPGRDILNSVPTLSSVAIAPAEIFGRDKARAVVVANDLDGDKVSYRFAWTVDGRPAGTDSEFLDPAAFRRDQRLSVTATPTDGVEEGAAMRSPSVTVQTTPPTQPGVLLSDPAGGLNDLHCVVDEVSIDLDADKVTYTFAWLLFDEVYTGPTTETTYPGDTVPKEQVDPGQRWRCRATPSDGTVSGASHEAIQLVIAPLLAAGSSHTCLLTSAGSVACWGADTEGQLVAPSRGTYVAIASNGWHTCVLDAAGSPSCWGSNKYGQSDAPSDRSFTQLAVGLAHTCGLGADGQVNCWGNPDDGRIDPPAQRFKLLAGGGLHSCAITDSGAVVCWGANDVGQASAPPGTYVDLSLGQRHSCALKEDRAIECWGGSEEDGQGAVPGGIYRTMASGGWHSCAVKTSGETVCWGLNDHGQASPPDDVEFKRLEAGKHHTCGITNDAKIHCWGRDNFGQGMVPARLSGQP
jgi:hypothetical protein